MPEPKIDLVQKDSLDNDEECTSFFDKTFTRRQILKGAALGGLAIVATACGVDPSKASENPKNRLKENIEELNNQFEKIKDPYLDEYRNFNYEPFKTYPNFETYATEIHTNSQHLERELKINSNVLKLMASSIVATNLGSWEEENEPKNNNTEKRIGPMQFYASHVRDTLETKLGSSYEYNTKELEGRFNIQLGITHLVYGCLGDIKNDGENKNLIELTLAKYYGGDNLLAYVKSNREVPEGDFLRENYDLYRKTLDTMGIKQDFVSSEVSNLERGMEEIWQKAANEYWPDTNLTIAKEYFFKQAKEYTKDRYNKKKLHLTKEQYLALFISIAMTESYGGVNRGPNQFSGACGWFQVVPKYHLGEYNDYAREKNLPQYNEEQLLNDPKASIEVGIWALMRYKHDPKYPDIQSLMRMFKGGTNFYKNWDDGIWWNRVSYCMRKLLGEDSLNLGYMDYELPQGIRHSAEDFEKNGHAGNLLITSGEEKVEN
jgi:hypothetical protein